MSASSLRTWNTSPEGTTRNCWSWRRCVWVELLSERGRTITNNTILVLRAILKLFLLQHQISSINSRTNRKMNIMSSFIFSVYIRYWFSSPSLTRDATNDLKMYKELSTFKRVDKTVSKAALVVLLRLTWYLTEDWISISLFNTDREVKECNKLAKKIGRMPSSHLKIKSHNYLPSLPLRYLNS